MRRNNFSGHSGGSRECNFDAGVGTLLVFLPSFQRQLVKAAAQGDDLVRHEPVIRERKSKREERGDA